MNDHNLDDLIIDTPSKKGSKAKGFLTIIALFIVVLIVAIILTKIILKDPSADHTVLVENETEMISPELTLQDTSDDTQKDEEALSEMIKSEMDTPEETDTRQHEKTEEIAAETVVIEDEKTVIPPKKETVSVTKPAATITKPSPTVREEKKETVKIPVTTPSPKPVIQSKPKPKPPVPAKTIQEHYYIQVGSFSKKPTGNSRLINTLKKQRYRYQIMKISNMYKVMIGPYKSRPEVDRAIVRVKDLINKSAFVVKK